MPGRFVTNKNGNVFFVKDAQIGPNFPKAPRIQDLNLTKKEIDDLDRGFKLERRRDAEEFFQQDRVTPSQQRAFNMEREQKFKEHIRTLAITRKLTQGQDSLSKLDTRLPEASAFSARRKI